MWLNISNKSKQNSKIQYFSLMSVWMFAGLNFLEIKFRWITRESCITNVKIFLVKTVSFQKSSTKETEIFAQKADNASNHNNTSIGRLSEKENRSKFRYVNRGHKKCSQKSVSENFPSNFLFCFNFVHVLDYSSSLRHFVCERKQSFDASMLT